MVNLFRVLITGYSELTSVETEATEEDQSSNFNVNIITTISNDGSEDIIFNFDRTTNQITGRITLKAGETLNNVKLKVNQLHYRSMSGNQSFRAWGV